jgi:hypothetical protein
MTTALPRRTPWEVVAVWVLLVADCVVVVGTYARIDPERLYHVADSGLRGGVSRALVLSNFPIALVAIALALVALDALSQRAWLVGVPAIAASAVTAWPGVVDQDDLSAKWVSVIPAVGVGLTLALTVAARSGRKLPTPRLLLDPVRVGLAAVALVVSIPWLAAELGYALPDGVFLMRRLGSEPDGSVVPAVHLGHHHGLDGLLILLSALALSRLRLRSTTLATVLRAYLGLALAYGSVNLAQDAWNEQLVKRGWLDWKIPSALQPSLSGVWLVVVAIAIASTAALTHEAGRARGES